MKILLAEDDKNLGKMLTLLLRRQNIAVDWAEDGEAAYAKIYADAYDVIVLDWLMPKLSGFDLCRRLREEEYDGKILLLTARDAVEDRVKGLNGGADDYLVKPFDIAELTARLYALVRRGSQYKGERLTCKGYTLELGTYNLVYGDERTELRPRHPPRSAPRAHLGSGQRCDGKQFGCSYQDASQKDRLFRRSRAHPYGKGRRLQCGIDLSGGCGGGSRAITL